MKATKAVAIALSVILALTPTMVSAEKQNDTIASGVVSGKVVDANDRPVADAIVILCDHNTGIPVYPKTYTLKNGLYKVRYPVKAYRGHLDRPIERIGLQPDGRCYKPKETAVVPSRLARWREKLGLRSPRLLDYGSVI